MVRQQYQGPWPGVNLPAVLLSVCQNDHLPTVRKTTQSGGSQVWTVEAGVNKDRDGVGQKLFSLHCGQLHDDMVMLCSGSAELMHWMLWQSHQFHSKVDVCACPWCNCRAYMQMVLTAAQESRQSCVSQYICFNELDTINTQPIGANASMITLHRARGWNF